MRTEDTGQRAKEYYHLRSTQRNKDERDNVGVGSEEGGKSMISWKPKKDNIKNGKIQNVRPVRSGKMVFVFFLIIFLNFPRILNRHVFCY